MRKWIPLPGYQAKLKAFHQYAELPEDPETPRPGVWSDIKVLEVKPSQLNPENILLEVEEVQNSLTPKPKNWHGIIPLENLSPPFAWEPKYKVIVDSKEKAEMFLSWANIGVHVWSCVDLGSSPGRKRFTPARPIAETNGVAKPHWSVDLTETIAPEIFGEVFDVGYTEENLTWHEDLPIQTSDPKSRREYTKARKVALEQLKANGWNVEYDKHIYCHIVTRTVWLWKDGKKA
jgi:hypothetical protein